MQAVRATSGADRIQGALCNWTTPGVECDRKGHNLNFVSSPNVPFLLALTLMFVRT
jgi:hypothetical protein